MQANPGDARRRWLPHLAVLVGLAVIYFLAGKLGLSLAFVNRSVTSVWPPSGISLAAILLLGYRVWPGIFLGAFLVNITTAGSVITCLGIATGNTLEAVMGAWLVNRFASGSDAFRRPRDIFKFAALAGGLSTAVCAAIGVLSLAATGYADWAAFGQTWLTWWLGDGIGVILVAPPLILWASDRRVKWKPHKAVEAVLLLSLLLVVSTVVFGRWSHGRNYPLEFLSTPVLLWAAFRFGPRDTALMILVLSGVAIRGTLAGLGPFARSSPNTSLLLLQLYTGTVALVAISVAAIVAERRRSEWQLHETERQLSRYNADLEHFAYAASHDLQEPLRNITLFTQLMADQHGKQLGSEARTFMDHIVEGVERMNAIIEGLLKYTRLGGSDAIHFELVSMNDALNRAQENLGAAIGDSGAQVHCNGLPAVRGDREHLVRLFQNLIGNAIKYRSQAPPLISVAAHRNGQEWIFAVSDNGIGIDPRYGKRVFELFERLHGSHTSGVGIGLAISKRIVELHRGRIWVESQPGAGSAFKFTIPAETEQSFIV
jgi:signal transduction histidine kinase